MPSYSNQKMNEYMKKRYFYRRKSAIEYLGGKCVNCGSDYNLHFDHIDFTTKNYTISKASSFSEERWWEEVNKCQLLCEDCHKKKTNFEGSQRDKQKEIECSCGRRFNTTKQYAGHKGWCK